MAAFCVRFCVLTVFAAAGDAYLDPAQFTSLGRFDPSTTVYVDARLGTMSGGAAFPGTPWTQSGTALLVFTFSDFNLASGVSIICTNGGDGSPAIAFLSQGNMVINGNISVDAENAPDCMCGYAKVTLGGAGGFNGGNFNGGAGPGTGGSMAYCGGSGGGFGGNGGAGANANGSAVGFAGATYNADVSSRLIGGSGGGRGSDFNGGGAGGVAAQSN